MRKQRVSGEKGSRESGARASSPATTCLAVSGFLPGFPAARAHISMIDMINMIWRASVPASRLPLCGRMVSESIAEHREGRASARPRASRRLPLPAAVTPHPSKPLRLCVKKRSTFNVQLSTLNFLRAGTPALPTAYTQNTHSTRMAPVTNRLLATHSPSCPRMRNNLFFTGLSGR